MYIITNENNEIINFSETIDYQENGNLLIDNGTAIAKAQTEKIGSYEVEEIPENIVEVKYCYTQEDGFYENENYKEIVTPEMEIENLKKENKILQEQITDLQLAITEIYESGV